MKKLLGNYNFPAQSSGYSSFHITMQPMKNILIHEAITP